MFAAKAPEYSALQTEIHNLLLDMDRTPRDSKEYSAMADQVVKLMKLQKETDSRWIPSPDAAVSAAASVLGILLILNYERAGVIGSKALSFVKNLK